MLGSFMAFMASMLMLITTPIRLSEEYGFAAGEIGTLFASWPFMTMLSPPLAVVPSDRIQPSILGAFGMCVSFLGMVAMHFVPDSPSWFDIAWRTALAGIRFGFFTSPGLLTFGDHGSLAAPIVAAVPCLVAAASSFARSTASSHWARSGCLRDGFTLNTDTVINFSRPHDRRHVVNQPTGTEESRFETYHVVARLLHWIMAFAIILAMILVIFREEFKNAFDWRSMGLHKSLGLLVFGLAVARLGWRAKNPPPAVESNISPGMQRLAHLAHILLYVLMIGLPILGYTISSAGPYPLDFFGIPVGKLPIDKDSWFVEPAGSAHVVGGYMMVALVVGHAGAALYHHFVLKDRTLLRMAPGRSN